MLVRDHTHSHFCASDQIAQRATTAEILAEQYQTRSIITVRHPLDSRLSLVKNGWISFQPGTLDEYASRYQAFLEAYKHIKVFKYEDFVTRSDDILNDMCAELELSFPHDFRTLFMAHRFSGDSGRKGDVIKSRDRRTTSDGLIDQASRSSSFASLCKQLNYDVR